MRKSRDAEVLLEEFAKLEQLEKLGKVGSFGNRKVEKDERVKRWKSQLKGEIIKFELQARQ